jgi:hypothetical protein
MVSLVRHVGGRSWLVAAIAIACFAGCSNDPNEGIKTYKVANSGGGKKGEEPDVPAGPATYRFLGAIIPLPDDTSYFVRFDGPIEQIDKNEKDFDAFLNSIRVPGEGGKPISWKAPEGWTEAPARDTRVVTLEKPDKSAPAMYISNPFGGDLLQNVNRWRTDFTGIKAVTRAELPKVTTEIMLGDTKAHRVDFRGPGGKGKMPPFMRGK